MKARIVVSLKTGVLDPQGRAIARALHALDFPEVDSARQGKLIEIDFAASEETEARDRLDDMCRKLLANPVIETYTIEIIPA